MATVNAAVTILATVAGVAITAAGLYFAYNHRRQVQLQLTDRRLASYAGLWSLMEVASPMRTPSGGSMSREERFKLFDDMTHWYFRDGHGMLLASVTREVYLRAKQNLVCPCADLIPRPTSADGTTGELSDQERAAICISQLSLLRTHMKSDIAVYGLPFHTDPSDAEKAFLKYCGVNLNRPPWSRPWYRRGQVVQRVAR